MAVRRTFANHSAACLSVGHSPRVSVGRVPTYGSTHCEILYELIKSPQSISTMVLFVLSIKAELDGIESLSLIRNTNLCFSLRNPLSDYEVREKVVFNPSELLEQDENDREPPHNFALRWEGSKKYSTLTVLDDDGAKSALKKISKKGKKGGGGGGGGEAEYLPRDVTPADNDNFVPVLVMECRGLEPYAFHPMGNEFKITSVGGTIFDTDVDLSEGDWGDYDEEHDASVSANDFQSKIIAI